MEGAEIATHVPKPGVVHPPGNNLAAPKVYFPEGSNHTPRKAGVNECPQQVQPRLRARLT
jgi:hypothetical protein